MNADFEFSGIYDEVNAATSTFCFIKMFVGLGTLLVVMSLILEKLVIH
jgi:hypothetical protein